MPMCQGHQCITRSGGICPRPEAYCGGGGFDCTRYDPTNGSGCKLWDCTKQCQPYCPDQMGCSNLMCPGNAPCPGGWESACAQPDISFFECVGTYNPNDCTSREICTPYLR